MRTVAAAALGNLGSPAAIATLNQMLLHDTIEVRLAAAEALTKVGDAGIKTLRYATRSDDEKPNRWPCNSFTNKALLPGTEKNDAVD